MRPDDGPGDVLLSNSFRVRVRVSRLEDEKLSKEKEREEQEEEEEEESVGTRRSVGSRWSLTEISRFSRSLSDGQSDATCRCRGWFPPLVYRRNNVTRFDGYRR